MRKDKRERDSVTIARVEGYHCSEHEKLWLFTSDRAIPMDSEKARTMFKMGLEFEGECWGISNQTAYAELLQKIVFAPLPKDFIRIEHDGSLGGDVSAECITQTFTKERLRNEYGNFKKVFEYMSAFNIDMARSGNCGMHTNLDIHCFGKTASAQEIAIRKFYYIVNHHYSFICSLVRRSPEKTFYCGRMECAKNYCKTMNLYGMNNHHCSMNMGHYASGRIEFRVPAGQKNYASFRNTMECILQLIDASKRISWDDCDDLKKIFAGCNQHTFDRLTLCRRDGTISASDVDAIERTIKAVDWQ